MIRTELLALLPGLLAWWVAVGWSVEAAFLGVYLPVLMLVPDFFRYPIEGLPDPTLSQAAILPIGFAVCWKAIFQKKWTFTVLDGAVFTYLAWQLFSDFNTVGFIDAQNLMFEILTYSLFPYVCGKALIESSGMRVAFARRFVWLLFVVCLISIYEFRMGTSLFRPILSPFFPGQDSGWFTQMRWGFGRIAGPYGHAILMGCIISIGLLLCFWLAQSRLWEKDFKVLGHVHFSKQQLILAGLLLAMVMTLSRGPWLGGVCGLLLATVGWSANMRWALKRNLMMLALVGVLVYSGGKAYLDNSAPPTDHLNTGLAAINSTEVEQSTNYRAQLFDKYLDVVMQRPIGGWGRANWPQVAGMASIDNNYLFIALNSGLVGVGLFLLMLIVASARLLLSGFSAEHEETSERAFHFTLLGAIVAVGVTIVSVFMGSQLAPLLFLVLGWADACTIGELARAKTIGVDQESNAYDMVGVVA